MYNLAFCGNEYKEKHAFNLIESIQQSHSEILSNRTPDKKALNDIGLKNLRELFERYESEINILSNSLEKNKSKSDKNIFNHNNNNIEFNVQEDINFNVETEKNVESNKPSDETPQIGGGSGSVNIIKYSGLDNKSNLNVNHADDDLRKRNLWRNIKLYTIFICFGISIILYIVLPFFINSRNGLLYYPKNETLII
jgi:hypothetical protein